MENLKLELEYSVNTAQRIPRLLTCAFILTFLLGCQPQVEPEPDAGSGSDEQSDFLQEDIPIIDLSQSEGSSLYQPRGIGGGGAMSGFSQSPYSTQWFVGTDMGTLFRSLDQGKSWLAVHHNETTFNSDLTYSPGVGFFSDAATLMHAPGGRNPVRSLDRGKTWESVSFSLVQGEYIESWYSDSYHKQSLFALTTKSLWYTKDGGESWEKILSEKPSGIYLDYLKEGIRHIYVGLEDRVVRTRDYFKTQDLIYKSPHFKIRSFTGGRDKQGLTLSFSDDQGRSACSSVERYRADWGDSALNDHYDHCGYLWVYHGEGSEDSLLFTQSSQIVGDHLEMAENDSSTLVVTGSNKWIRQYGTKVWISRDYGENFELGFHQMNWDVTPYEPWPSEKLDYSAVGLDIGWYDNGYVSFSVNQRNSSEFGGTGFFFLHTTQNKGEKWDSPFTSYEGNSRVPAAKENWSSTGLEVTTVYRYKFHPQNSQIAYAAMADVSGMVSEDGGRTHRLTTTGQNSIYDYAFDFYDDEVVFAVSGSEHDYPINWHANWTDAEGGVFKSLDRGRTWSRLTPQNSIFNRQFLSIGYDSDHQIIYAGTQSEGVAISYDGGGSWSYQNNGLPSGKLIIPQIEVDPLSGDAYALVTGNAPDFTNHEKTGIYLLKRGESQWKILRGVVHNPMGITYEPWFYPTAFALDLSDGGDRSTLYLTDYENNRNWLATGIWKSTDGGDNWYRVKQYTHPLGIKIDPFDSNRIYVSGLYQLDGNWGEGGHIYSDDGGQTWKENESIPYLSNGRSMAIDPNDENHIFYTFFGSGLLYGPKP